MNRTIIGIIVAVLLCLLGAPFATGLVAESRLDERIAAIDANNAWLAGEVTSYQRGWFSSVATVELGLVIPQLADLGDIPGSGALLGLLTAPIPVRIEITHGPVSFDDGVRFGMAQVTARPDPAAENVRAATDLLGIPYLFEFRGRAGFGGRFDFDADVPPISYQGALGETRFSGLALSGFASTAALEIRGGFDRLGYQSAFAAGALEGLTYELRYEPRADRLPVSRAAVSAARFIATSPLLGSEPILELGGLTLRQSLSVADDNATVAAATTWSAALIATANGQRINDAEIGITLSGIDAGAAAGYYRLVDELITAPPDDPEEIFAALAPVADTIVRRGFEIRLEPARFSTEGGTFSARVIVTVDGSRLPPGTAADIRNIAVLLETIAVNAEITATKPLAVELAAVALRPQLEAAGAQSGEPFAPDELAVAAEAQAGLMLTALLGQGLIVDDGDNYTAALEFADGALRANGQPLPGGIF